MELVVIRMARRKPMRKDGIRARWISGLIRVARGTLPDWLTR